LRGGGPAQERRQVRIRQVGAGNEEQAGATSYSIGDLGNWHAVQPASVQHNHLHRSKTLGSHQRRSQFQRPLDRI